jgi:hypothetical protein
MTAMAKKNSDKAKLPKRIGGIKLTKELRKAGGKLLEKANSPMGRELIAVGLSMAAAAASKAARRERDKHAADKAPATNASPTPAAASKPPSEAADPHDLGVALGNIAQEALGRLFQGKPRT